MNDRCAAIDRDTRETQIKLSLNLDGTGVYEVKTPVPFLSHMLELFSRHSLIDLKIEAGGDVDIDDHHTVEDLGLVLGSALDSALGDRKGIRRYGWALLPMDDALSRVALDLGGRPYFVYDMHCKERYINGFDTILVREFFRALMTQARMNLHIAHLYGDEPHHAYESVFKGFAKALRFAVEKDPRDDRIPSSKGVIDGASGGAKSC